MKQDSNHLLSIQLEVSNDSINYKKLKEVKSENLGSTIYVDSLMSFLRELINEGKLICKEQNYTNFRLRICTVKENYFLYDASLKRIVSNISGKPHIPVKEKQKYELLTRKEKEILCFLYRGYRQNDMAYIFGTTVHTIKKHRYNIFEKAGFRNQADLAIWCDKYLEEVFQVKA